MVLRTSTSGTCLLLARVRSRMLRFKKHNHGKHYWLCLTFLLTVLLLIPPNLVLLYNLTNSIPRYFATKPFPILRLEQHAGGNPDYRITPLQQDVRNVTRTMYRAYMSACAGRDEFEPTTNHCHDWFNIGLTTLDSLDTLILMGLEDEYKESRKWAAEQLSFNKIQDKVSMFELVIRAIGGLNSAYQLTNDSLWLSKSVELGDMLLRSFGIQNLSCPPATVFIGDEIKRSPNEDSLDLASTPAEAGSLQLEFRSLSQMTGDPRYTRAVDKCQKQLISAMPPSGLVPSYYDVRRNAYYGRRICLGGGVDSFYEMLVKNWIIWGKEDVALRDAYQSSVESIYKTLAKKKNGYVYIGEMPSGETGSIRHTMDHLTCFFPGTLAIAAQHGLGGGLHGEGEEDYMPRARALTDSCYAMTRGTRLGLAGEITDFTSDIPRPRFGQDMSFLRPEIVEALYYMDKLDPKAGDKYKKMGRTMWEDMRKSAQVENRPDGVMSSTFDLLVAGQKKSQKDKLHSFVIAETFKYFYLLFDERPPMEGPLPLDQWVYNTEAHPVRIVNNR